MSGAPYLSSEDSALLRSALQRYSGGSCLEIGAGNGGNLVELSKRFGTVAGTDIVRPSMADWRDGASYFLADRASCIKSSTFDLVFFNPPYLAEEGAKDVAVEGGRGLEVPRSFLREALRVVRRNGAVVFLLDDTAELQGLERVCSGSGFSLRRVGGRRLFYEGLAVYEAKHGV